MPAVSHSLDDIEQSRKRVVPDRLTAQHAIVPVTVADEVVVLERIRHHGGEDRPRPVVIVHHKRVPIRPTTQLLPPAAANEIVVRRIEWKQDAHASIRIGMQDY